MTDPVVLQFDGIPHGPNDRLNWRQKAKENRVLKQYAEIQTLSERNKRGGVTFDRVRLSACFFRRAVGQADVDNEIARLKPLIDGIVLGGLIPNDTPKHLIGIEVTQGRGPRGVVITVIPMEEAAPIG